jgi:hypothetical protein
MLHRLIKMSSLFNYLETWNIFCQLFIKYQWIENSFVLNYKGSREGSKKIQVTSTLYQSKYVYSWYLLGSNSSTYAHPNHSINEKKCLLQVCNYLLFSFYPTFANIIHTANLSFVIWGFSLEVDETCILQGH